MNLYARSNSAIVFISCVLALAAAATAQAQTLTELKLQTPRIQAGQSAQATVNFDLENGVTLCGMRINWGDGTKQDFKINQAKDAPLVASHRYSEPGLYELMAEPKTQFPLLKCRGSNQHATLVVAPATPAVAPGVPVAAAKPPEPAPPAVPAKAAKSSPCTAGAQLAAGGVNSKTGAYTCTAQPGAAIPTARSECPGELSYFANVKKRQWGCRA